VTLNPFEVDMRDRLVEAGIPLSAQYGVSGFRIDFAAHRPDQPTQMVLAIETDGASYHASPTVRDRERLRQQHMERLGWRFHRIWSTDWFTQREKEIARAIVAYNEALAAPAPSAPVTAPPPEAAVATTPRGPRPELGEYEEIGDLPDHTLAELVTWIESDGLNRTEEEVVAETISELGFQRRGTRIVEAIVRARRLSRPVTPMGQE
jgi:very-short-patch-repair endonuclease